MTDPTSPSLSLCQSGSIPVPCGLDMAKDPFHFLFGVATFDRVVQLSNNSFGYGWFVNAADTLFNYVFYSINPRTLYYIEDVATRTPVFVGMPLQGTFELYFSYRQVVKFNNSPTFDVPPGVLCYNAENLPYAIISRAQNKPSHIQQIINDCDDCDYLLQTDPVEAN